MSFLASIESSLIMNTLIFGVIKLSLFLKSFCCFVVISGSALHALYELIDWNFRKFFETLKFLTEQFQEEKDSADILRLCLLQMNIKHLSDFDIVMDEASYAKSRLEQLLSIMKGKVQEYQANIRGETTINKDEEAEAEEEEVEEEEDEQQEGEGEPEAEAEPEEDCNENEDEISEDEEEEGEHDDDEEDVDDDDEDEINRDEEHDNEEDDDD